jgi:hypothetical protein
MDRLFRAALAALMISPLLMCGSSAGTLCDSQQICEGGNDKDVLACKARIETAQDVASTYGCSGEYSKVLDCAAEKGACINKNYKADGCAELLTAYATCINAASASKVIK